MAVAAAVPRRSLEARTFASTSGHALHLVHTTLRHPLLSPVEVIAAVVLAAVALANYAVAVMVAAGD